jgi:hypothetical protein
MIKLPSFAVVCFLHNGGFGRFHISHQLKRDVNISHRTTIFIRRRNVFQGVSGHPRKTESSSARLRKKHLCHFKIPEHLGARYRNHVYFGFRKISCCFVTKPLNKGIFSVFGIFIEDYLGNLSC